MKTRFFQQLKIFKKEQLTIRKVFGYEWVTQRKF
jgi:hypothetical protein